MMQVTKLSYKNQYNYWGCHFMLPGFPVTSAGNDGRKKLMYKVRSFCKLYPCISELLKLGSSKICIRALEKCAFSDYLSANPTHS